MLLFVAVGNRTPHYSSMTPSHDGSRTPGQSGAWDPTITNTPAHRSSDLDAYSLDEASPSPGYNPSKYWLLHLDFSFISNLNIAKDI